jgi:hypothetical protein
MPAEPSEPYGEVPPRDAPVPERRPPAARPRPAAPEVELPPEADPVAGPGPLERAAAAWLAARLAAVLVSLGLPGGVAGVAGGAIVWLVMRRGRRRLQDELARLRAGRGGDTDGAPSVVERHHNRYVPFEVRVLDKAWAAAHARVGEKYPGAVPYLKIVEGVKDQLLSGNDEPQIS